MARVQHVTLRVTAVVVLTAGLVLVGGVGGGTAASGDLSVNTTNTTDVLWATSLGSLDALTNTTSTTVDSANTTVANTTDALNDTIGEVENTTTVTNTTDDLGDTTAETSDAVEGTTALILTETTTTLDATTTTLESTVESDGSSDVHDTLTGFGLLAEEPRAADTVAGDPGDGRDATAHAPRQRRQDRPERSTVTDDPVRAIVVDVPTDDTEGAAGSTPQVPPPVAGAAVGMQAILAVAAVRELAGSPARVQTAATVGREIVDGLPRMVVPLRYSRYDDSDPLAHETRAAVLQAIDDAPGIYLTELGEQTDVTLSTLRHHVRVLEDENLVASAHVRGRSRFYPAHTEDVELAAALNDDATAPIVEALTRMGPATVSELAAVDSRDASTITHHLQNLEADGVVVREREGRAIVNQLAPDVRELLAPADLDTELPDVETALSAD